jgi:hypothetical protein
MPSPNDLRTEASAESFRRFTAPIMLVSLVVLIVCYFPSFSGPWVFDDRNLLPKDPQNRSVIDAILDQPWRNPAARPLVTMSFQLETCFFGESQAAHRIMNLSLHFLTGLAMLSLARLLTQCKDFPNVSEGGKWSMSMAGTMLWLFHPLNSATVAYVAQRSESLMGLGYVLFLYCAARWRQTEKPSWLGFAILAMAVGVYSKTIIVTAPVVLLLMDRAFLATSWRDVARAHWKPAAVGLLLACLAIWPLLPGLMRGDANVGFGGDAPPIALHLAAQCNVLWLYLFSACWPTWLSIDHGLRGPATLGQNAGWILMTGLLLFTIFRFAARRRWKLVFMTLSPLIILAPTSSFIPTADLWVDHRMYLPLAFVTFGFSALLFLRLSVTTVRREWLIIGIILIALAGRCHLRAMDYSSGMNLWKAAILENPENDRAIQNLIEHSFREKRETEVLPFLRKLSARLTVERRESWVVLARLAEQQLKAGDFVSARRNLRQAFALEELETPGSDINRRKNCLAAMHVNMAICKLSENDPASAERYLESSFDLHDSFADARALAGSLARDRGDIATSEDHFQRALELRPGWKDVEADLERLRQLH